MKESRVLPGQGPAVVPGDEQFSAEQKSPAPGNIIEYRITYTNLSESQSGVGNRILNAGNVVIIEDGTTAPNNWALDNDSDSRLDTSNVPGTASDSNSGTITFFPRGDQTGDTAATDVIRYENTIPDIVAPQTSGEFRFQRQVN